MLDEMIADRVDGLVGAQEPDLRQERAGLAQAIDLFFEADDRARFHVGDDDDMRTLAGAVILAAAEHAGRLRVGARRGSAAGAVAGPDVKNAASAGSSPAGRKLPSVERAISDWGASRPSAANAAICASVYGP